MKISDIGERALIEKMMSHLTVMPKMPIPFWDDVNAISLGDGRAAVLKTDMLVWGTDIPSGMTPFQAGRKAVVMNFSDLGSKGVQPQAFLAALGAPSSTTVETVEEIVKGFEAGSREYDGYMIGGDTNESAELTIAGMAFGIAEESKLMKRSGSYPGDILATTGGFGHTTAAFKILLDGLEAPNHVRNVLVNSVYMPKARVKPGIALAETGVITSCMDSSDGLAVCLYDLQRSSGNGFRLEKIPLTDEATKFADIYDMDKSSLALYGGEEYELVFTIRPDMVELARIALRNSGSDLLELGVVTKEKEIYYVEDGVARNINRSGWEHFKDLK